MKHALFTAVLGLAVLATPSFAQEREGGGGRQGSPLKAEMEKLDEALEAVGEFLKKPEGDAPLAQVAAAEAALNEAKKHEPRATQRQPEGSGDPAARPSSSAIRSRPNRSTARPSSSGDCCSCTPSVAMTIRTPEAGASIVEP